MYNFQNDIQTLGMDDFQTEQMLIWDPQTQSYYTADNRQDIAGGRCGGGRCGGGRCGGDGRCGRCGNCGSCFSCFNCFRCFNCFNCFRCFNCFNCFRCFGGR
ncbi:heterocycloanthracin/sonorensin family bacteriocin [Priestia megaterium]|nr:heterocycloanthracin/sonorensin family bacteriocin [Priestia megaterium]